VIRIAISAAAFEAIARTTPPFGSVGYEVETTEGQRYLAGPGGGGPGWAQCEGRWRASAM